MDRRAFIKILAAAIPGIGLAAVLIPKKEPQRIIYCGGDFFDDPALRPKTIREICREHSLKQMQTISKQKLYEPFGIDYAKEQKRVIQQSAGKVLS